MYIGVYNACLGDKPLGEALDIIKDLGLNSVEVNSGGFLPPIHLPVAQLQVLEPRGEVRMVQEEALDGAIEHHHPHIFVQLDLVDQFLKLADHRRPHDVERRIVEGDPPIGRAAADQADLNRVDIGVHRSFPWP
jgi:hypothetical protein